MESAVKEIEEFASSWLYKFLSIGESINNERDKNPLLFDLKLTFTLVSMSAMRAVEPGPTYPFYNRSTTTQASMSGLGTLNFASRGRNLAFGLNQTLDDFSNSTGFINYRQFTSGGFQKNEILSAIQNPSNNLNFNLQGFTRWKYLKYQNNPVQPSPALRNVTNWELHSNL